MTSASADADRTGRTTSEALRSSPAATIDLRNPAADAHLLWTPTMARPWWRTDERIPDYTGRKIWTDCCCCRQPAAETDCRITVSWEPPVGGFGCYQEEPLPWATDRCEIEPEPPTGSYFDPRLEVRCAEGFGCTVNPRKKSGRHLREWMRYGA